MLDQIMREAGKEKHCTGAYSNENHLDIGLAIALSFVRNFVKHLKLYEALLLDNSQHHEAKNEFDAYWFVRTVALKELMICHWIQ